MTDRAKRLGLEPGSVDPSAEIRERDRGRLEGPSESEIAHSIAISLKRIADALDGTTLGVDIGESLAGLTLQRVYRP